MKDVYALLETRKLTPELSPDAVGEGADKGPQKGWKGGKGQQQGAKKAGKATKRKVSWKPAPTSAAKGGAIPAGQPAESRT